jgi:hypothetical protein
LGDSSSGSSGLVLVPGRDVYSWMDDKDLIWQVCTTPSAAPVLVSQATVYPRAEIAPQQHHRYLPSPGP